MALDDLSQTLEKESEALKGIMFPFKTKVKPVTVEQNVYDASTDGIMTVQNTQYTGPDATIQYGIKRNRKRHAVSV